MHTLSPETLEKILSLLNAPFEEQEKHFNSLELNPYDNYDPFEVKPEHEFMDILYEDAIEEWLNEALEDPHSYLDLPEEKLDFIQNGGQLSEEELNQLRESHINELRQRDDLEKAVIAPITDGKRTIIALYIEQAWGQAGLHINEFIGFYRTDKEAEKALMAIDGIILDRKF